MVRGEDPGEEKFTARRGGRRRRRRAVAMRGVWILLEHMKWKKGTDGGGVGGRKKEKEKKERVGVLAFSAVLQPHRGRFKGVSAFCPAVVKKKKKSKPMSVP